MSDATLSPTIRAATTADLQGLVALVAQYYMYDGISFDQAAIERGLRELLAHPVLGGVWLIYAGGDPPGEPAGYFVLTYGFDLEFGGRQATITELFLKETHRRGGLGSAALRFAEQLLCAQGIGALELQAERHNQAALAFYKQLGFEAHDRIPLSKRLSSIRTADVPADSR